MIGTLKWSIIYYLMKPNESNNSKGNEAYVQDLPFLCKCCRAGAVAAFNPQPDPAWTHAVEHFMPHSVAAYCHFTSSLRTVWAWPSDTQELCPSGLVSSDGQDLDQAATESLSALHIWESTSRCSSEPNSFVVHERNSEGQGAESWGGKFWRRMVGEAFRKELKDTDGMHWRKNLGHSLFLWHGAG